MGDISSSGFRANSVSNTSSGGGTRYGETYGISSPGGMSGQGLADSWWNKLGSDAAEMNRSSGGRGGGGGGGGGGYLAGTGAGGWVANNFEDLYSNPGQELEQAKLGFQQQKWNQAFGALTGMMGRSSPFTIGGSNTAQPEISVGPITNPQLLEQQISVMRAKNDQTAASRSKEAADMATGRGLGVNSPLIAALQGNIAASNIAANAAGETDIRARTATDNASHVLKGQDARESAWEAANQLDIARMKPYFDQQNALIAALAGIA